MSIDDNVGDILSGSGAPALKFPTIGTVHKGTIVSATVSDQRDPATGNTKTFPNGNPMKQVVITLNTDDRDPAIEGDDGERRLFVKGHMITALREAVKKAGAKTIEVGGTIAFKYDGDGERKPGLNAPKLFVAQYQAPVAVVDVDSLI